MGGQGRPPLHLYQIKNEKETSIARQIEVKNRKRIFVR